MLASERILTYKHDSDGAGGGGGLSTDDLKPSDSDTKYKVDSWFANKISKCHPKARPSKIWALWVISSSPQSDYSCVLFRLVLLSQAKPTFSFTRLAVHQMLVDSNCVPLPHLGIWGSTQVCRARSTQDSSFLTARGLNSHCEWCEGVPGGTAGFVTFEVA